MARRRELVQDRVYRIQAWVVAREMLYREVWNALEYLQLLEDGCRLHNCRLHAWCLMPGMAALMVSQREIGSISGLMNHVQIRHTRRYNSWFMRRGPLWDGPYEIQEIPPDELDEALREMHCVPSIAGLCVRPDHFEWSDLNPRYAHMRDPLPRDYRKLSPGEKLRLANRELDIGHLNRN
ncbi:MAG: hypothetical protein H6678_05845 [Candidatus Delongbacteria bacterium]|nr:hypothetical protein [Candidatus Cloacimonadota bacterium]MCB9473314.1 hypothetical protein [Candidatus Delongbacteria bacterium]